MTATKCCGKLKREAIRSNKRRRRTEAIVLGVITREVSIFGPTKMLLHTEKAKLDLI